MKISYANKCDKSAPPKITLNDIPIGTVFSGTLNTRYSGKFPGIWYKAEGRVTDTGREPFSLPARVFDCVVVRLDRAGINEKGFGNFAPYCIEVEDYKVLDVELVIKN